MTPEEELIERSQPPENRPCRNCGHNEHGANFCWHSDECGFCQCPRYEPMTAEDILADEHPEEI